MCRAIGHCESTVLEQILLEGPWMSKSSEQTWSRTDELHAVGKLILSLTVPLVVQVEAFIFCAIDMCIATLALELLVHLRLQQKKRKADVPSFPKEWLH